jgi:hypothetical protein
MQLSRNVTSETKAIQQTTKLHTDPNKNSQSRQTFNEREPAIGGKEGEQQE